MIFPIVNFPFMCCTLPALFEYGAYISLSIGYSGPYSYHQRLSARGFLLKKLLNQGFLVGILKSLPRVFFCQLAVIKKTISQHSTEVTPVCVFCVMFCVVLFVYWKRMLVKNRDFLPHLLHIFTF